MDSAAQNSRPYPDWVACEWSSRVHVCCDRAWFENYTPFATKATSNGIEFQVEGVGTVALPIQRFGTNHQPQFLFLKDVLYIPSYGYNVCSLQIIGGSWLICEYLFRGRRMEFHDDLRAYWDKSFTDLVFCTKPPSDITFQPSRLKKNLLYLANLQWSTEERSRWSMHRHTTRY